MDLERRNAIKEHISTHSEKSQEDIAAVNTLRFFLLSEGRVISDFDENDKWPNHDGTFEYVSNPEISRVPKKAFYVQIKGTTCYTIGENGNIHYQLKSLAFPAFIANDVTSDPGILFVVLNPETRGKERVFWKYMSPAFLAQIDFKKKSRVIEFLPEDELLPTNEGVDNFCNKIERITRDFLFLQKLDKDNMRYDDLLKIIEFRCKEIDSLIEQMAINPKLRDQISRQILPSLTDLCYSVMMLNAYDLGYTFVDEKTAWDLSRLNKNTKYLSDFLRGLKYIGCKIPDDGQSERLMLKYKDYLCNIKFYLCSKFPNEAYLDKLELFPSFLPQLDEEYYKDIAYCINSESDYTSGIRTLRYYIQSVTPFFVENQRYYEITLQLAEKNATKFHRITVYSKIKVISDYSIKIAYHEKDISLFGIQTKIKILDNYKISILPRCLNLISEIIKNPINISSNYGEYDNLMNFLTNSGMNLIDLVDLKEDFFNHVYNEIYSKANTDLFGKTIKNIRKDFSMGIQRHGQNTVRYALLYMREDLLESVLEKKFESNYFLNLAISPKCRPFDTNPWISNLHGHITTNKLSDIFRISTKDETYLNSKPYIEIVNLTQETGELFFGKNRIKNYDLIEKYNNNLNQWQKDNGYSIIKDNDLVYIDYYEKKTISILKRLIQWANSPCDNQKEKNKKFIRECTLDLSDCLKKRALENLFVNSHILLIYGAAGTGKTKLIEYIFELMKESNCLFLTNTHTALQNLKRRINQDSSHFKTIDKCISERSILNYDLLFIDECSTIDNRKMEDLLNIIPNGTKVVLSGDIYQIESIEFGNWFHYAKEIINTRGAKIELLSNFRTTNDNLITLWDEVRNKESIITEKLAIDGPYSRDLGNAIFENAFTDEVVLCLNYDGKFGLNSLNKYFQDANRKGTAVNWEDWTFKKGDRILFLDTNRFTYLYNNLKGVIIDIEKHTSRIIFTIDVFVELTKTQCSYDDIEFINFENGITRIKIDVIASDDELSQEERKKTVIPFQLGYAVSIYKAQGLEYDSVKIVIPSSNEEKINHSIFYTAITRAKENLKIYWSAETMTNIVSSFTKDDIEHISLDIIKNLLE